MKRMLVGLCLVVSLSLGSVAPSLASSSGSGTLSASKRTITWKGSFVTPYPGQGCVLGKTDPGCDHFALKLNLGDKAQVKINLPVPATADFDLYVMDPNGNEVAHSGNEPGTPEVVDFVHRAKFRNKAYDVQIVPFLVTPGTTFKATAKITKFVK